MLATKLIDWVIVMRPLGYTVDALNNPTPTGEVPTYEGQARLVEEQEKVTSENNEVTFIKTYKLILPADADVTERDRVLSVHLASGVQLTGAFVILTVLRRRFLYGEHHVTAMLEKVT